MSSTVDVCVLSYNRKAFTQTCLEELAKRTTHPHRIIVIDNGSTDGTVAYLEGIENSDLVDAVIYSESNYGVHWGWNRALEEVVSNPYFVTLDNDIVPQPGWLGHLVSLMERHPEYGAICLRAQAFIGQGGDLFKDSPEIKEMSHVPAYCRIMRTDVMRKVGGWLKTKDPGRNNEDWTVGKRMNGAGYKVGFSRDIRCIHLWQDEDSPWGYPVGESVGHREIWPPVWHSNWDRLGIEWNTCAPKEAGDES